MVVHAVLLIAIPLLSAFLIPLIRKISKWFTISILTLNSIFSILVLFEVYNKGMIYEIIAFSPPVGIYLAIDNLSALLALIINVFGAINFVSTLKEKSFKFHMLYLLAIAGSTGIVITGDIFNMFVFFEITAVASYALVASKKSEKAVEGAIKYMILGSLGSTFILMGIALIYSQMKSLNIYDIANRISMMNENIKWISFAFLLTGIGVEAELFPLNGWVPDVYEGASSGIASLLSFGPSKAAIYAIARLLIVIFPSMHTYEIALWIGVATLLMGEIAAFMQTDAKRMLAYSSIGQMGLILIAFSLVSQGIRYSIPASFFLIVSHASAKSSLFLLSHKNKMGSALTKYGGITAVLSLIGMPPLAGFWGKWYLFLGAASEKLWLVIILIFFSGIIEAAYFARYLHRSIGEEKMEASYAYPMAVLSTFSLAFGLLPFIYKMANMHLLGGV
ncbi:MAG: hypothetical protein J7J36_06680 [Thermoplasmata archaeon]|nr:hypothetical protein [Thermoplasmata archaeon]